MSCKHKKTPNSYEIRFEILTMMCQKKKKKKKLFQVITKYTLLYLKIEILARVCAKRSKEKQWQIWCSWDRASQYISIVQPTRCTIFQVYWISLYIFRTVFLSIIRSPRLYIQHQVYVTQVCWLLASRPEMGPLASSQWTCMTYTWRCTYSLELLIMDGKTVRNMYSDIQ